MELLLWCLLPLKYLEKMWESWWENEVLCKQAGLNCLYSLQKSRSGPRVAQVLSYRQFTWCFGTRETTPHSTFKTKTISWPKWVKTESPSSAWTHPLTLSSERLECLCAFVRLQRPPRDSSLWSLAVGSTKGQSGRTKSLQCSAFDRVSLSGKEWSHFW